jgi:hypothetical protein
MSERPFDLQSRDEEILAATIDGTEYTDEPQSRIEYLLLELKEVIEGGGSSSDYADLSNKPKINNVTLDGNKSWADLGLSNPMHIAGRVNTYQELPATANEGDVYLVGLVAATEKEEYVYVSGGWEYLGSNTIEVDSAMSTTSENPVQNKVITAAVNANTEKLTGIAETDDNYMEMGNGIRLYVSDTEPTGTIPEGSIGVGW